MTAETNTGPMIGQRHLQAFLLFLSIVVNYMAKFNAGVAVVAMTNAENTNPDFPFLGGWLCRRYGARITMFVSTIGSALLALLPPWCVSWGGWQAYCVIRMSMGLFQGFLFPCIHAHLANWCPVNERNRLGALANTASSVGWPGIFYVSCAVGVFWCIIWLIFGANTPRESKFISEAELNYIETSINSSRKAEEAEQQDSGPIPVPWKAIWTSSWGYSTLQTEMPAYMNGVLLMDMKSNALYSALPYFTSWMMAFVYLIVADILLTRGVMSITGIRKTVNSIAFFVPALALIGTLAVVLMCANVGINAGNTIGSTINTIDLSPNHAGILMGIINTAANVVPILTPLLVGIIVKDDHDREQWQIVFIISAVIFFVGNLIYIAFGQMVNQPWDAPDFMDKQRSLNLQEDGNAKALEAKRKERPLLGMRHVQTLLIFLNITCLYIGRLNVGVSVVAMTNADSTNPDFKEYDWSLAQKSYIISSFFWGYIFTQFLGGYLCKRFGVKSVMLWGSFASGVCSALTPVFIGFGGWQGYCGIRGLIFPCIHQHLARWSPPAERNRLGALSHTGIECGNVCAMFLSGMIAKSAIGWPGISYVSAGVAIAWCVFWAIFAADNALNYIESSLKHNEDYHKTIIPIPWKAICTSAPFLALLVARCCESWGLSTLQAQIPTYMNGVLDMDMKSNAFFSALPFLAMWLMSLTALRKTFNSLAFWIPSATLIGIGFLDQDQKNLAIVLMTISVGVNSGATIGTSLNTIDLSPNHASILMGIVNTAANVVPIANRSEWQVIFIIASVLFFFGNCVFLFFGTAVAQPWDAEDYLQLRHPELALVPALQGATKDMPKKTSDPDRRPVVGMRHVQALLIFLNISVMFLGRLNVGVSVVAMTNAETTNPDFPEYDWTEAEKSYILSSFFWGYIFTQFLGGYLCKRYGVKSVMFWGVFGSGVCSTAYCGIRVLMGLAQGVVFPCIHQHLAKWSPPAERNRLGALAHTGIECGNVIAMFLSGIIAKSSLGWPGISYVSAGFAFFWCANYHKTIIPIPWKAIWTSAPFLALLIVRCSQNWGLSTLQAEIPSYMNGVLDMDMKSNAFFSALPFFAMWLMSYIYIIAADVLMTFWIPAATLVGIGFLDKEQKNYAIALMTISVGVNSAQTIGSILNTIDLSENHASILMGIVNTAANFVPIVTPLVVGWIVEDNSDRTEWQIVFIIASVFFFVGNCIYLVFGTAVTQPWDAEDFLQLKEPELANASWFCRVIMTHKPSKGPRLGVRHLQSFLLFLGLTVMHIARLNVSVAIVAMTNAATTNPNFPEFEWTEKQKSYILSSFYWGYILTLFPGSFLCRRFGAKVVLFVASCGTAVFSLMTPWCLTWGGWQVFCAIRILQGLFQGHLAMWSPPEERNRLGAFSYTGTDCGTVLAMFISGMIAKGAMGWPGISYVSGSLCAAWCFLWLIFASNNATESRFHNEDFHERTIPIPWKAIWTSVPFLALLVTRCAETYGLSTLQAEIPSYMNGVLNMEIQSNAVFSSLPFLAMWLLSYVYLIAADKKILSLTAVRKLFNSLSFWIPAAALIGIGFLSEENKNLAIVLMTVSVGVNSGATIGSSLNSIDLSPNHAGILIGLSNTVANHNRGQWQIVFGLAAVIFFVGNVVFIVWGTAKAQPWDADDFLVPKDAECASEKQPKSPAAEIAPPIDPVLEQQISVTRFNMSVAIVAFTNANSSNPNYPEYRLTEQQKSYILSSPFWGSCCTHLMSGYLSSRFGAKILLLAIMLLTALISTATPFLLFWVRLVQGLAMGGMWPCLYTHLAKWCPKKEANRLGGVMTTGLDCGTIIGFALSGVLSASPLGWPSAFYVPGYLGIAWCLLFLRYGANSPSESRFISLAERKHIELDLEQSQVARGKTPPVPWLQVLTSRPFIVLAFFYTLMQQIPRYIHGIFRYSITMNALLSALPFVVMLMSSYGFIFLAEYLTRHRDISLPILRKTINSFATWTPAVALNVVGSMCCLVAATGAISGQAIGSSLNHVDLSPNFAGLLFGISNTLMSAAGSDRTQWRTVFLGISVILFLGNLFYVIFGRMTVQPWNDAQSKETTTGASPKIEAPAKAPEEMLYVEKFNYL
ncbi:hypothetical protein M5D96_009690 [Drosophila gunungcola]|uniref:Putative inorganic phosphate cotransporter n=1 Tax=Drosophila gunungcola TaxID=103775 RepID=A0A9Q0BME2_9MUSC|nr:hypothetical protein M5D96_009690 [Drosophila gunungcola]